MVLPTLLLMSDQRRNKKRFKGLYVDLKSCLCPFCSLRAFLEIAVCSFTCGVRELEVFNWTLLEPEAVMGRCRGIHAVALWEAYTRFLCVCAGLESCLFPLCAFVNKVILHFLKNCPFKLLFYQYVDDTFLV